MHRIFLRILVCYLSSTDFDGDLRYTEAQWRELYAISAEQGVSALIFDYILRRQHNMPLDIKMAWGMHVKEVQANYHRLANTLAHLTEILDAHGIPFILLKGIGLAQLYPNPEYRECGDIDIYAPGHYDNINSIVAALGIDINYEGCKHSKFILDGVVVENHYSLVKDDDPRSAMPLAKSKNLNEIIAQSVIKNTVNVSVKVNVRVTTSLLYLMQHTYDHLQSPGITFRHITDLYLLIRKYKDSINWQELQTLWQQTGELHIMQILLQIISMIDGGQCAMKDYGFINSSFSEVDKSIILYEILHPWQRTQYATTPWGRLKCKYDHYHRRKRTYEIIYQRPFPDSLLKGLLRQFS